MKKHKFHSIKEYGVFPAWRLAFTHWGIFKAFLLYMKTVLFDFFLLQYAQKFHLTKRPLIHVDNILDNKVPFVPAKIKDYLGFVKFWIRPLSMLDDVLGSKKAAVYMEQYVRLIERTYREAGTLYKYCLTTTERPKYKKDKMFRLIHIFDPHYLCVPSLHISVVTLCYSFFRNVMSLPEFTDEMRAVWLPEIYNDALNIAETVLYVKQHSVNCIPAALYMMTFLMRPYFTAEDGVEFLNNIFKNSHDINAQDKKSLTDYMQFIYERFLLEGVHDDDWKIPVKRWLKEYAKQNGQEEVAKKLK